jgi:hypothetical protein
MPAVTSLFCMRAFLSLVEFWIEAHATATVKPPIVPGVTRSGTTLRTTHGRGVTYTISRRPSGRAEAGAARIPPSIPAKGA